MPEPIIPPRAAVGQSRIESFRQIAPLRERARTGLDRLRDELLAERTLDGHWTGELSPSSLSTATAISAMSAVLIHATTPPDDRELLRDCIGRGIDSLRQRQNVDGGYGDTDRSHSNVATSYLVLAAAALSEQAVGRTISPEQTDSLRSYLQAAGEFDALRERYGADKTFVVPIMTNLAIAGLADWNQIPPLPFEAAVFPQAMYRLLQMPVVSYAIPALVAIGQTRHFHGRRAPRPLSWVRSASVGRTMNVLQGMQPQSGGFLEATPLTAFVVMSLAATERGNHPVSRAGLRFLIESMDEQGSWPIDTNLATWVTSLAMHALSCDPQDDGSWCTRELVQWQLGCQHRVRHPYTGAEPGGWGWSDLSGAVPDSDDTPAAILALGRAMRWRPDERERLTSAVRLGVRWLRRLQNRDGGWPTFCRGWGKLPFDRSSNDLTAHAIRALQAAAELGIVESPASRRALQKAREFLQRTQQADGSWLPLWFGNQDRTDESNPVYGTSRVLVAGVEFLPNECVGRGCEYLIASQNVDGGWGGGPSVADWLAGELVPEGDREYQDRERVAVASSIEETALAVDALATVLLWRRNHRPASGVQSGHRENWAGWCDEPSPDSAEKVQIGQSATISGGGGGKSGLVVAIIRGVEFLLDRLDSEQHRVAWPIGFYFAKLWYHERLYPLVFSTTALGKFLRATADQVDADWPR